MVWTVAQARPGNEKRASDSLIRRGFTIYNPLFRNQQRHKAPLFPGYLFIKFVHDWHGVFGADGISHYFLNGKYNSYDYPKDPEPVKIADKFINELKSYEDISGVIRFGFRAGQRLRILRGKFSGMMATYQHWDPKRDLDVAEFDFMGRKVSAGFRSGHLAS